MEPDLNTGDEEVLALPEKECWITGALAHEELESLKESILLSLLALLRRGLIFNLGGRSIYCGDDVCYSSSPCGCNPPHSSVGHLASSCCCLCWYLPSLPMVPAKKWYAFSFSFHGSKSCALWNISGCGKV
jgi:hypothetical protein